MTGLGTLCQFYVPIIVPIHTIPYIQIYFVSRALEKSLLNQYAVNFPVSKYHPRSKKWMLIGIRRGLIRSACLKGRVVRQKSCQDEWKTSLRYLWMIKALWYSHAQCRICSRVSDSTPLTVLRQSPWHSPEFPWTAPASPLTVPWQSCDNPWTVPWQSPDRPWQSLWHSLESPRQS